MKRKILVFVAVLMISLTLVSCGKKYIVTFDTQGGSEIASVEVKKNKTVAKPENPVKEGYDFVEWQLDGTTYDFSSKVKKDITLVAKWVIPAIEGKVKIIFDSQGGSKVDSVIVNKGSKINEPTAPIKDGSVFAGWQLNGATFDFNTVLNENITLVAVWKSALVTPTNVKFANNKVTWDNVNGATGYNVYVNGVKKVVNSNEYVVDLNKEVLVAFSVAATSDNGLSETTETVVYTKEYSISEIVEKLDVDEDYAKEYLEEFRIVLGAQEKFGVSFDELEYIDDPIELLQYVQNGKTSNVLSFFGIMLYARYKMTEYPEFEMPKVDLQALFDDMKTKGAYSSTKTNYEDDDKFEELVVPFFGSAIRYSINYKKTDVSTYNYIQSVLDMVGPIYSVIRNDDSYTFTKYDGKEFVLTKDEIESIKNYYVAKYNKCEGDYSLIEETFECEDAMEQYMYEKYMYDKFVEAQKIAEENVAVIIANFEKNKDVLNATASKLYDAYETAMGYQTKLEELMGKFQSVDSEEALSAAIEDARNFAIQVAELIEDNLPTEAEVQVLIETLEGYGFVVGTYVEDLDGLFTTIETLLNTAITTINETLSIIEEISVADVESILGLMQNPEDEAAIETIKKIVGLLEGKLSGITIKGEVDLETVLGLLFISNGDGDLDQLKSQISILFNIQFTDEQVKELEDEVNAFVEYIEAYDLTTLEELLPGLYTGSVDPEEALDEIFKVVDYVAAYFTVDKLTKYEKYIKCAIDSSESFENNNGEEFYQLIKKDFNIAINALKVYNKLDLIDEMYGDYDYETLLECKIEFAKSQYTNAEYKAYMDFIAKGQQLIDGDETIDESYKENAFYKDYQGSLDKLTDLVGKTYLELTEEEQALIYDLELFMWVYPLIEDYE